MVRSTAFGLICLCIVGAGTARAITRSQVLARAQTWVDAGVPYSQTSWYANACGSYRQDCSGYVSMAWALPLSAVTSTLPGYSTELPSFNELKPGDAVNQTCCHVFLFKAWIQPGVSFTAYEEADYGTVASINVKQVGSLIGQGYRPYRLNGIQEDNRPPVGYLDGADASCVLKGWAQDPDAPQVPLGIHIYLDGPAGTPGAAGIAIKADVNRPDLCKAIGSCNHGFQLPAPNAYRDGKPHSVHAYTFDSSTGAPVMLKDCPKSFTCAPPQPPVSPSQGIKRWVVNKTCFGAWKFEGRDVARFTAAQVAAYADGPPLPSQPVVVIADDGTKEVWVIDGSVRRHVTDPASLQAWRFGPVVTWPAAQVLTHEKGKPWPASPFLLQADTAPAIYVLDRADAFPAPVTDAGAASAETGGASAGDAGSGQPELPAGGADSYAGAGSDGGAGAASPNGLVSGCSVSSSGGEAAGTEVLVLLLLLGIALLATGRRARGLLLVGLLAVNGCQGPDPDEGLGQTGYPITAAVEQWRNLVEKYFKYQHVTWALNIMQCESGGNPNAYNASSGASGLFQHLAVYWPPRAAAAGFPGASPFNGEANIAASANLLYASGPGQWSCKYSPFEDFNYQPVFFKNGAPVPPPNKPPAGYLDGADGSCALVGWAQDPDAPQAALEIHIYLGGPAGAAGALGVGGIKADVNRPDLCQSIGSCNHGFRWPLPNAYRDGKAHSAYAYTFDSATGAPTMLKDCPKSFTCAPPQPPIGPSQGAKRWVTSTTCFQAWKFELRDVALFGPPQVAAYPNARPLPAQPLAVQADDGSKEVWVIDGSLRRVVTNPASLQAWRFTVATWPAAQVLAYPKGTPWPASPFLVRADDAPAVYVLDQAEAFPSIQQADRGTASADRDSDGGRVASAEAGPGVWEAPPSGWTHADAGAAANGLVGSCSIGSLAAPGAGGLPILLLALLGLRRRR